MHFVDLSQRSQKFLNKLNQDIKIRIENKLKSLKENTFPSDAKFIGRHKGDKVFRYRIGDYIALYKIKNKEKIVLISKIDKRPRIYKK